MPRVEVIVPVRNEEQTIPLFVDRVRNLTIPDGVHMKIVFVEDSSTDGTRALLQRLAHADAAIGYYSLAKGFGQAAAAAFGLYRSTADAAIMMDVDGSHPTEVLPEMLAGFLGGARVVQCVRKQLVNRLWYRRFGASVFHGFASALTGVDTTEQNIFFRLVSADVLEELRHHPRYWHYLRFPLPRHPPGALRKIDVDTTERALGESKYDLHRLINLAIDGVLSQMPTQRFAALVAVLCLATTVAAVASGWMLAGVPLLLSVWLLYRYRRLYQPELLQRMQVLDSANVP